MMFKTWLLRQADRDDAVGELARSARRDRGWHDRIELRDRMTPGSKFMAALDMAEDEWQAAEGGKIGGERGPDDGPGRQTGSRSRGRTEVGTFANWLKGQVSRGDGIGYAAKYWESVTPGKISAVSGVERHLQKIKADFETQPEGMSPQAWDHARVSIDAALSGLNLAIDEYHREQALEVAQAAGAVPKLASVPDEPPQDPGPELVTPAQLAQAHERAVAAHPVERGLAGSGADLHIIASPAGVGKPQITPTPERKPHETVTETGYIPAWAVRIEARLDAIGAQNELILQFMTELVTPYEAPGIDWDQLAAMADFGAVAE